MSVPVPIGVRIYNHTNSLDVWVTQYVENLTYRSVVPGGFANASFRLHVPQHMAPVAAAWSTRAERSSLVRLFNRVQIVDQRSAEIVWEGRIDSAARVDDDGFAWDIGCAGAMISASDITRPVFYVDSELTYWLKTDGRRSISDLVGFSSNDNNPALLNTFNSGADIGAGIEYNLWYHTLCFATNQYLARVTCTYSSTAPSATGGTNLQTRLGIYTPSTDTWEAGVDVTNLGAADTRKSNPVGAANSFTSTQAQVARFQLYSPSTNMTIPSSSSGGLAWVNPVVVAMRTDRNGNDLTAPSNYSTDYVTVSQVVEDVVGRYLNNAWGLGTAWNVPAPGSVNGAAVSIDTSDTTPITDLKWVDGATAADILNRMMQVQTNAYWAIWESSNTATNDPNAQRYRFEWTRWPASWGYLATSVDGLDEQPDASDVYNFVWYQYQNVWSQNIYINPTFNQEFWDFGDPTNAPLLEDVVTRGATVKKDGITDDTTAYNSASAWIAANGTEVNAGSITIKRPIQLYDSGTTSYSGAARMIDPWAIRPGKLIKILDLPPRADMANFAHGTTAPPATHTGTIFRVVATEYNADDNACRLELDQVTTWSLPGQILPGAKTNVQKIPG